MTPRTAQKYKTVNEKYEDMFKQPPFSQQMPQDMYQPSSSSFPMLLFPNSAPLQPHHLPSSQSSPIIISPPMNMPRTHPSSEDAMGIGRPKFQKKQLSVVIPDPPSKGFVMPLNRTLQQIAQDGREKDEPKDGFEKDGQRDKDIVREKDKDDKGRDKDKDRDTEDKDKFREDKDNRDRPPTQLTETLPSPREIISDMTLHSGELLFPSTPAGFSWWASPRGPHPTKDSDPSLLHTPGNLLNTPSLESHLSFLGGKTPITPGSPVYKKSKLSEAKH